MQCVLDVGKVMHGPVEPALVGRGRGRRRRIVDNAHWHLDVLGKVRKGLQGCRPGLDAPVDINIGEGQVLADLRMECFYPMFVVVFPIRLIGDGWKWLTVTDDDIRKYLQVLVEVLRDTLGNVVDR